jgi:hypothetical protein
MRDRLYKQRFENTTRLIVLSHEDERIFTASLNVQRRANPFR